MIVLGPLIDVLIFAIEIYVWLVIISAIMSWLVTFNVINTSNRAIYVIGDSLYRITEPALRPIRKILPNLGGIDVSPIILILGLFFVNRILANILVSLADASY